MCLRNLTDGEFHELIGDSAMSREKWIPALAAYRSAAVCYRKRGMECKADIVEGKAADALLAAQRWVDSD